MIRVNRRTNVYKNLRTGVYFVQPFTRGPVGTSEFGAATVIQPEEFDSKIVSAVIRNLEKFGKEKFDIARAIIRNDKQQREFLKSHIGISVSEQESGDLKVYALHREGGGMVGSHDDTFVLPKAHILEKLTATIADAFKRAT